MKKTLLALAALALFTTACQKTETGLSNAEKMIVGKWRLTYSKSFTVTNGVVSTTVDELALSDSCSRDDLMDLRSDHSYYMDQNSNLCFPLFPKELPVGSWKLLNNDQELALTVDSPLTVNNMRILELTANRLRLYKDVTISDESATFSTKLLRIYEK